LRVPIRTLQLLFALLVIAAPGAVHAQLPAGYIRGDSVALLPDTLRESLIGGRFRISVTREAGSTTERHLIATAESLIPPKDSIEAAASKLTGSGWVRGFADARLRQGPRWWWREWNGIWLPYAVTGEAIAEYIRHVRTLSTSPNPFARTNPAVEHRASLEYRATVRAVPNSAGHRVELVVQYNMYCGPQCGLRFRHTRTVTFDQKGTVIRVEGDRPPAMAVS
jgi:hypothetical protein